MNIYHYNSHGVFTHISQAQPNPKRIVNGQLEIMGDGNDYLVPDKATLIEPPQIRENEIAVFRNGQWHVEEDLSGKYIVIDEAGFIKGNSLLIAGEIKPDNYVGVEVPVTLEKPKWENGEWIEGKTENEKWEEIRSIRNALLSECDYTMLVDVNETLSEMQKSDWLNYRQYLRDIPSSNSNPFRIIILTKEEFING